MKNSSSCGGLTAVPASMAWAWPRWWIWCSKRCSSTRSVRSTCTRSVRWIRVSRARSSSVSASQNAIITSGTLFTGTYWAYQDNNIYTWEQEEHVYGDYSFGNHTFKFGAQFDRTAYTDTFIPNAIGSYTFNTPTDFMNTKITSSTVETPAAGFTLASVPSTVGTANSPPSAACTIEIGTRQ